MIKFRVSDYRSVDRYKRGKSILREGVNAPKKQNRAKIVPLAKKEKAPTRVSA